MQLLLMSSGIANTSIRDALVGLLGKPIEESSALVIPTAIYPFPGGAGRAWEAICGRSKSPFAGLGCALRTIGNRLAPDSPAALLGGKTPECPASLSLDSHLNSNIDTKKRGAMGVQPQDIRMGSLRT